MLAGSQKAWPTLVVLLARKFTKGERLLTQNLSKESALALPAQGEETGREGRGTPFPTTPSNGLG